TKHHDDICRREWIGDSPQIHGFLQQRRTHDPDQPRKASYEERGRGRSTSAPKPDRAAARRRGHWVSVRCVHLSLRGDAYRNGREHRCKSAASAAASSACCFSHSATLVRNWPMPNVSTIWLRTRCPRAWIASPMARTKSSGLVGSTIQPS